MKDINIVIILLLLSLISSILASSFADNRTTLSTNPMSYQPMDADLDDTDQEMSNVDEYAHTPTLHNPPSSPTALFSTIQSQSMSYTDGIRRYSFICFYFL